MKGGLFLDGIYLQGVHRDYEDLAGSRLLAIEGVPVEKALELMRPVVPAENEMFVKAYGIHYLTFPEFLHAQGVIPDLEMEVELTLEKNGEVSRSKLMAVASERFPQRVERASTRPRLSWSCMSASALSPSRRNRTPSLSDSRNW